MNHTAPRHPHRPVTPPGEPDASIGGLPTVRERVAAMLALDVAAHPNPVRLLRDALLLQGRVDYVRDIDTRLAWPTMRADALALDDLIAACRRSPLATAWWGESAAAAEVIMGLPDRQHDELTAYHATLCSEAERAEDLEGVTDIMHQTLVVARRLAVDAETAGGAA